MTINNYGVVFADGTEIVSLHLSPTGGWSFLLKTKRQEIEGRVTPSGLIRLSKPRKPSIIHSTGVHP